MYKHFTIVYQWEELYNTVCDVLYCAFWDTMGYHAIAEKLVVLVSVPLKRNSTDKTHYTRQCGQELLI